MKKKYNIVFFANSEKSFITIKSVIKSNTYKKIYIFTQKEDEWEPKYINKLKLLCSKKIKLFTLINFSFLEFEKKINKERIDFIIAVGWRKILEDKIVKYSLIKSLVMHDSLLPKNRGFAPLNWAIIKGEKKTGVSLISMDKLVDSGDIYLQDSINIKNSYDIKLVHEKILRIYSLLILKFIKKPHFYLNNPIKQKNSIATFNPKRKPKDGLINWNDKFRKINNLVRALKKPWPGAYFIENDKTLPGVWE